MRLVYTADLHGVIASYRALLAFAVERGAQAAIVGGDLLPPAISRRSAIAEQRAFVEGPLRTLLVAFRATYPATAVYLLAGNDDWAAAIRSLDALESEGLAFALHERVYALGTTLWLAGYACVPVTPFSIKDYERLDDGPARPTTFAMAYTSVDGSVQPVNPAHFLAQPGIAFGLAALAQRSDPAHTIYVCHTPPADTPLDLMQNRKHVGSLALRSFIERFAPPLTLHGHIHEAPRLSGRYATRIGATWCINPGHDQRTFHAVFLDTDDIAGTLEHTVYGRYQDT